MKGSFAYLPLVWVSLFLKNRMTASAFSFPGLARTSRSQPLFKPRLLEFWYHDPAVTRGRQPELLHESSCDLPSPLGDAFLGPRTGVAVLADICRAQFVYDFFGLQDSAVILAESDEGHTIDLRQEPLGIELRD